MPLSTHVWETPLRVRYAETDAMGIAHHSAYVVWLEAGRVDWMRSIGLSYADLERAGYSLPVVELRVRYVAPSRFDDELVVRTGLSELRSRSARFTYEIVTAEPHPRQVANATTQHICMRAGAVARMPDSLRAAVERTSAGQSAG